MCPDAGVEGVFEYVSPHSKHNLRYLGGGREANTGQFDRHKVLIRNGRLAADRLTLERSGFTLVRHSTAVDLYDQAAADTLYPGEIERVLLDLTGADKVVLFGARRRHVVEVTPQTLQAATDVHVDYDAPNSRRMARQLLGLEPDAALPYSRFMAINIWRALSPPPQDRPLAVCDASSVRTQSGTSNTLILVDEIPPPEAMAAEAPAEAQGRQGFLFHFDPAHRWYYYPDMTADEIVLFKLYDSTETGPWRCPHASFVDPTVAGVPPRESYEIRSFVYFR